MECYTNTLKELNQLEALACVCVVFVCRWKHLPCRWRAQMTFPSSHPSPPPPPGPSVCLPGRRGWSHTPHWTEKQPVHQFKSNAYLLINQLMFYMKFHKSINTICEHCWLEVFKFQSQCNWLSLTRGIKWSKKRTSRHWRCWIQRMTWFSKQMLITCIVE